MFNKHKKINNYRLFIYKKLKNNKLKNNILENRFNNFLLYSNYMPLNSWINICGTSNNFKYNLKEFDKILNTFSKTKDIIYFKELFELDADWYLYFHTSADINGRLINNEKRLGVDRNYVNDITKIQKKTKQNLDNSINFYLKLKIIFFHKLL